MQDTTAAECDDSDGGASIPDVEEWDEYETITGNEIDFDNIKLGSAGIQDLLTFLRKAELPDALPYVASLLGLAVVMPLTSVHRERAFSRHV